MVQDFVLAEYIVRGQEARNLEYKGARGQDPFVWGPYEVNAKVAKTAMAMANIGGGTIIIGMDQVGPDEWEPNGVPLEVNRSFQQDEVRQFVAGRTHPYVDLTVSHFAYDGRGFVIIQVAAFDELPVVCVNGDGKILRTSAVYTRSFGRYATVEIQSQTEMREILDRAIEIGVEKQLRPLLRAMREELGIPRTTDSDAQRFERQRGEP